MNKMYNNSKRNSFGFLQNNSNQYEYTDDTYSVQKNDSLWSIAKKFDVSVEALVEQNDLTSAMIYPNQILVIPRKINNSIYFEEYITSPKDTLESIANYVNLTPEIISRYNDITKLELASGQVIKIPKVNETKETRKKKYMIKLSDDLQSILQKNGLTEKELLILNENVWLEPGKEIYVK